MIRTSDTAEAARDRLMGRLRPVPAAGRVHPRAAAAPADQVLPHRAREGGRASCARRSPSSRRSSADEARLRAVVSDEMAEVAQHLRHAAAHHPARVRRRLRLVGPRPRRSAAAARPLEIVDAPCWALLSGTGLLARTADERRAGPRRRRSAHDVRRRRPSPRPPAARSAPSPRADACSACRCSTCPGCRPPTARRRCRAASRSREVLDLEPGERVLGARRRWTRTHRRSRWARQAAWSSGWRPRPPRAVTPGRSSGSRTATRWSAARPSTDDDELVLVTSDAQLLHFAASAVRPAGPAGRRHGRHQARAGARVVFFGAVRAGRRTPRRGRHRRRVLRRAARARRRARRRSRPSRSTRARAGPPAACGRTGSCAARTRSCWPGSAPPRPAPPAPQGRPSTCRRADQRRDGSGTPLRRPGPRVVGVEDGARRPQELVPSAGSTCPGGRRPLTARQRAQISTL